MMIHKSFVHYLMHSLHSERPAWDGNGQYRKKLCGRHQDVLWWSKLKACLVAQTPMQHIPGINEPHECHTRESYQGVAGLAPKPAAVLTPREERVIHHRQRSQNSQPAYELNDSQQGVEARTQHANVLFCHRKEPCQAA